MVGTQPKEYHMHGSSLHDIRQKRSLTQETAIIPSTFTIHGSCYVFIVTA
jgi:hypothetical protein